MRKADLVQVACADCSAYGEGLARPGEAGEVCQRAWTGAAKGIDLRTWLGHQGCWPGGIAGKA